MSFFKTFRYLIFFLIASLLVSTVPSYATVNDDLTFLEKIGKALYSFFHPFETAGKVLQQQEIAMVEGKPLKFKGIILGVGTSITGKAVDLFTGSTYSHVMFLIENRDNPQESFCYQSNVNLADFSKFIWPQVNLVSYQEAVSSYTGSLYQRNFVFDDGKEGPNRDQIFYSIKKYLGRPYEQHLLEYLRSTRRDNKKEDSSSIFCSELIALVLQDLDYLPSPVTCQTAALADNYLPSDFAEGSDSFLKLKGVKLGNQTVIKK